MGKSKTLDEIINEYASKRGPLTEHDYATAFMKVTKCSKELAYYYATHQAAKEVIRDKKR